MASPQVLAQFEIGNMVMVTATRLLATWLLLVAILASGRFQVGGSFLVAE